MANKTIYGCLNLTTKQVVFQGEACDDGNYTGCYVSSGVHEGQIAVTISEANCDDTYYACFDSTTGRFSVDIPDDCCRIEGITCSNCGSEGTPETVVVVFEGVESCGCTDGYKSVLHFNINNIDGLILSQVSGYPCLWRTTIPGGMTIYTYCNENCTSCSETLCDVVATVSYDSGSIIAIDVHAEDCGWQGKIFQGEDTGICVSGVISNNNTCADYSYSEIGTATLIS